MMIVNIFYLNRVTLKLKVIYNLLSMEELILCMTFTFKVMELVHSNYYFFLNPWSKKT